MFLALELQIFCINMICGLVFHDMTAILSAIFKMVFLLNFSDNRHSYNRHGGSTKSLLPTMTMTCRLHCAESTSCLSVPRRVKISTISYMDIYIYMDQYGYHLPRRHRSSRGVERKKQNLHSFIVASFNAQSVKGNDMACKRCEISTFIKDNGVDLFFVTETWLSPQGDEAKTVN